jgi:hypothetical protein
LERVPRPWWIRSEEGLTSEAQTIH